MCVKEVSTYIATQVNKEDCSNDIRHRQETAFSLGHSPCPHTQTSDTAAMQPHAVQVCGIMVSTRVIHVIT